MTEEAQGPQIQGDSVTVSDVNFVGGTPAGLHAESQKIETVPSNREFGLKAGLFLVFTNVSASALFLYLLPLLFK
jgi:hypothetical protein